MNQKLTKKQQKNLKKEPLEDKEYILTDFCFWETNPPEDYNPLDPKRKPHSIQLVDVETGTVALLPSGSIIKVVQLGKK